MAIYRIPRRNFAEVVISNFRQNLVMLCRSCHCSTEHKARKALKAKSVRGIPFSERLPEAILLQLEQGGSVSRLVRECDFSPLGNIAEAAIPKTYFGEDA